MDGKSFTKPDTVDFKTKRRIRNKAKMISKQDGRHPQTQPVN